MSTGLRAGTNNDGYLQVNGTDVLTALSSGKIGIGTDTPAADIHLETSSYPTLKVQNTSGASGFPVVQLIDNRVNGVSFNIENGRTAGSLNVRDNTSTANRITLDSTGDVGIGTNNPTQKLHVVGSGLFNDGVNGGILLGNSSARRIFGGSSYNGIRLYVTTGEGYIFYTNDSIQRLSLTNSGNLTPGADATQDLGSSSLRWANIYSADLQLSNEGSANDVDGTWGQYTIQEGENDLFLLNRRNSKKYKFVLQEVN